MLHKLGALLVLFVCFCSCQQDFIEELLDIQSTVVECDSNFPDPGHGVCNETNTTLDFASFPPFQCALSNEINEAISFLQEDDEDIPMALLQSPEDDTGAFYPNRQLCKYTPPRCPTGFQLIRWSRFDVEERRENIDACADHIELFLPVNQVDEVLENAGVELDRSGFICGSQQPQNIMYSVNADSRQVQLEFRSGNRIPDVGFTIIVMCTPDTVYSEAALAGPPAIGQPGPVPTAPPAPGKPGTVPTGPPAPGKPGTVPAGPPGKVPTKPLPPCTLVPDPNPPPTPKPVGPIVKIGNSVNVPRPTFLIYRRNALKIVQGNKVLRKFRGIYNLTFWTPNNGTRSFTRTAGVPDGTIFGGGRLTLINGCGYYINYHIPPEFMPNAEEMRILSALLDATVPFFRDQVKTRPGAPGTTPTPRPPSPGVNQTVLELALANENACNNFLRTGALHYLAILRINGLLPKPPTGRD